MGKPGGEQILVGDLREDERQKVLGV